MTRFENSARTNKHNDGQELRAYRDNVRASTTAEKETTQEMLQSNKTKGDQVQNLLDALETKDEQVNALIPQITKAGG